MPFKSGSTAIINFRRVFAIWEKFFSCRMCLRDAWVNTCSRSLKATYRAEHIMWFMINSNFLMSPACKIHCGAVFSTRNIFMVSKTSSDLFWSWRVSRKFARALLIISIMLLNFHTAAAPAKHETHKFPSEFNIWRTFKSCNSSGEIFDARRRRLINSIH